MTTCRVGYDSLLPIRREILRAMRDLDQDCGVETEEVAKHIGVPKYTARRRLQEIAMVIGGLIEENGTDVWELTKTGRELFAQLP